MVATILAYTTFYSFIPMSAVHILKYFNALWRVAEALRVPLAYGALAAVANLLLMPANFVGWMEGKGERLWLRWHSPRLAGHMEELRRVEMLDKEKAPLLDEETGMRKMSGGAVDST